MTLIVGLLSGDQSEIALYSHHFDTTNKKTNLGDLIASHKFTNVEMKEKYQGNNFPRIIRDFFTKIEYNRDQHGSIYGAVFAIAGLVKKTQGVERATLVREGFKSEFTGEQLKKQLPSPFSDAISIKLLNDMEAIGYAIISSEEKELEEITNDQLKKRDPNETNDKAPKAIMLVSGGLGQICFIYDELRETYVPTKQSFSPLKSEGGHSLFAPRTKIERDLLTYLTEEKKVKIVSYEYVLSEPGLLRIYEFLTKDEDEDEIRKFINENSNDTSKSVQKIIERGCTEGDSDNFCKKALDIFMSIYGARSGDIALTYISQGGLYLGGIDIPKREFNDGVFIEAFLDKEPDFKEFNREIPLKIFKFKGIVLKGAGRFAIIEKLVNRGIRKIGRVEGN